MILEPVESFPERLERVFNQAWELKEPARSLYVAEACGEDQALRHAVEALLESGEKAAADPLWNESALHREARELAGDQGKTRMDRYRLLEQIGSGGMGMVYKAVRADDEFSKLVAIKIVQAGDRNLAEALRRERQILAGLEHPHIARLLDGGTTADGLPFLVMEYVDGLPIDRWAVSRSRHLHDRLELFLKICGAVAYAHRNLVVHRDLKPGNILVTAAGEPKLLDFGIAKLMDGSAQRTQLGMAAMTPDYASPEQLTGAAITTSSDIYSLGVLLYELLTGRRPHRDGTLANTPQALTPLPSIDTDLENIVQMALRQEPERRYASADQFAADIRRYLDGYPVTARADTRGYRARKFVARNKTAVGVAALAAVAVCAALTIAAWQAYQANQRFNETRELAHSVMYELHDAIVPLPGSTAARKLLATRALTYLDRLSQRRVRDTGLASDLAGGYLRIADVQGSIAFPSLGDRPAALESLRKALAIYQRLFDAAPTNAEYGFGVAECLSRIGRIQTDAGQLQDAERNLRSDVAILERLVASNPTNSNLREELPIARSFLGNVLGNNDTPNLGDTQGALAIYRQALAERRKLVEEQPSNRERRLRMAESLENIAVVLAHLNDKTGSTEALQQAVGIEDQLVKENPLDVMSMRGLAVDSRTLSLAQIRVNDLDSAQRNGDRSAELFAQLAQTDPGNMEAREALADSYYSQGYLLSKRKNTDGALERYQAAEAVYVDMMALHPGVVPGGLRTVYQLTADLYNSTGKPAQAILNARKELEEDEVMLKSDSANTNAQRNQGVAEIQMGRAHELLAEATPARRKAEWLEARSWYQRSLDVWVTLRSKGTLVPSYVPRLAEAASGVQKCDRALK